MNSDKTPWPDNLTNEGDHARYSPALNADLDEAVKMIDAVIRFCCRNAIGGLFIDVRGLTGFSNPTATDRFWYISKWAETAAGRLTVVMLSRPELMDPDKIGVTMARNRGFNAEVFTDESEALTWLRAELRRR